MPEALNPVQVEQSIVYAVFDLTDQGQGSRKHISLHRSEEGAAAVVTARREGHSEKGKNLIYFETMDVLP
jgi:hypothetical protein